MPVGRSVTRGAVVAAAALLVASCTNREAAVNKHPHTGSATATLVNGVQQLTIVTGTDLRFHPSNLVVHPGKVRILLENKTSSSGGPPHDLQVTGLPGAFVPLTVAGQTGTVTFTTPAPGTYRFVCTIHEAQGQTGTLVVRPAAAQS